MQLYSFVAAVLLFPVVCSQDCNFIELGNCTHPVTIPLALGQQLIMTSIIESRDLLCSTMDRDEFEKLAKCAKDDPICSGVIFKTNETNPYVITANLARILKTEHRMEPDRIKLLYDIVCDQSCVMYLEDVTEGTAPAGGNNMGNPCSAEGAEIAAEIGRLQAAQGVVSPADLNATATGDLTPLCNLHQKFLECTLRGNFGKMGTCNTLKNAISKTAITNMLLNPIVANFTLASECDDLKDNAYNAYFTGSDTSSADYLKFSSLLVSVAAAVLFFNW